MAISRNNDSIPALCLQMCPPSECAKRKKNGLVHLLETDTVKIYKNTAVNDERMVKCYSRSAAGQILNNAELLRPPLILMKTVNHLLTSVLNDARVSRICRYDFINDRLRSVKQDAVIQRLSSEDWFLILPPLIRFYALSAYCHCTEKVGNFDQKLNSDQLKDSLLHFISNYQYENHHECKKQYAEVEALYLILDNSNEAINRALLLDIKESIFKDTLNLMLLLYEKRYFKLLSLLTELPLLPACLFCALHLNRVRKEILQIMSYAYGSKNVSYPLDLLKKQLMFNSMDEVIDDMKFYEIPFSNDRTSITFMRVKFRVETARPKTLRKLDEKISQLELSNLLLKPS